MLDGLIGTHGNVGRVITEQTSGVAVRVERVRVVAVHSPRVAQCPSVVSQPSRANKRIGKVTGDDLAARERLDVCDRHELTQPSTDD